MSYENTHLWAAGAVKEQITIDALRELVNSRIDYYYFGAVFPDTFSFSHDKKISDISNFLHGETGIPPNEVVFDMLDRAKRVGDQKNLAFICGFLTHCAMDIVFHPIVFYFSGYKPESSPREVSKSAYLHWHLETYIDKRFNNEFYLDRIIKPTAVHDLVVASILNISEQVMLDCLKKQIAFFRWTRSRFIYKAYKILSKIGLVERKYLGGFYANLKVDPTPLPEIIRYRNIISGEDKETTMDDLMNEGINMGVKMAESAYDYYCGKISRQVCEKAIVGNSLATGQIGKTKGDIRFSIDV